jgi:hypothetical protein
MTKMISGTPHKMDNVEAANSTQGHSRPRHPTAPPLGGVPIFPKVDSVRKILRSSLLRRSLWRSKLGPVSCGGLHIIHPGGAFR